jgi:glycosyltransferase involved in cell wall biosynthesis
VHFLGYRRDIAAVYAAADALLLPSRYDAFANVCLEAAAAGLPVVTSAATGAAELLRALGGVVDDPEDVAGFAAELDRLADAALRERRGAAARGLAEACSWGTCVAALREQLRRSVA